ncbi:MAG: ABC transporter substrate-binding protein, partial [Dehalococcoidia bacterium]
TSARQLTRRKLLGGAGAGFVGLAAAGLVGCGGGSRPAPQTASSPADEPTVPAPSPTATATPPPRTGGTARLLSPRTFSFDTLDTLRSGDVSTLEVLARAHSRLIQWTDFERPSLGPDLAASWEQPDPETWLLRLDPAARWHPRPPLDGRAVTATDVVAHFERAIALAKAVRLPSVQRPQDLASIRRVSSPGPGLVRIDLSRPDPFLPLTLAARFALVQAPEAVESFEKSWHEGRPAQVAGSGPFILGTMDPGRRLVFSAHLAGHRPPRVDGLEVLAPVAAIDLFREKRLDETICLDRREAPALRAAFTGEVVERGRFREEAIISTLFVGAPPWDDARLVRALSGALNRVGIARDLFGGRAIASGPVPPPPGLSPGEAARRAGYEMDADAAGREAKALWDAAGGASLGTVTIDFPSIFDPLYSASSFVTARLNAILGPQFRPAVETYTTISKKAVEHRYGNGTPAFWFGWGPPFVEPDPSRWLIETYASDGSGFATTGFASSTVDTLLKGLGQEMSLAARAPIVSQVQDELLAAGGGGILTWAIQRDEHFRWAYLQGRAPTPWPSQHLDASIALDPGHATFATRP